MIELLAVQGAMQITWFDNREPASQDSLAENHSRKWNIARTFSSPSVSSFDSRATELQSPPRHRCGVVALLSAPMAAVCLPGRHECKTQAAL